MPETIPTFEGWRPVVDFEGLYEVSDAGRVRRTGKAARHGKGRGGGARLGHVLAPLKNRQGYRAVQLWRGGEGAMRLVHVLVATAFLGPPPDRQEVNHRDGDKTNNALANLEYVTRSENARHAYRTGLRVPRTDQMVAARRKPRITVLCACGCGQRIETPDDKGRDRKYVSGHNMAPPAEDP